MAVLQEVISVPPYEGESFLSTDAVNLFSLDSGRGVQFNLV